MEKKESFTLPTVSGEDENESLLSVFAMVTISAQMLIANSGLPTYYYWDNQTLNRTVTYLIFTSLLKFKH